MLFTIFVAACVFLFLDSFYLNTVKPHYDSMVKDIQGSPIRFRMSGAIFCYLFLIFGLHYFILSEKKSIKDAFFLGLVIYAVYEFTNYAIFDDWKLWSVIIDTLWGGILYATTTFIVYNSVMKMKL